MMEPEEGILRFDLVIKGVRGETQNSYPYLGVVFPKNVPISIDFATKTQIFENFEKLTHCYKDFLVKNGTINHVQEFVAKTLTHLDGNSSYQICGRSTPLMEIIIQYILMMHTFIIIFVLCFQLRLALNEVSTFTVSVE